MLLNLRNAMVESEASNCVDVFVRERSKVLAAQMRALEEKTLHAVRQAPDLETHAYIKGKHPLLPVPKTVLDVLRGEIWLAHHSLPEGDDGVAAGRVCEKPVGQLASFCTVVMRLDAPEQSPRRVLALLDVLEAMQEVHADLIQLLISLDDETTADRLRDVLKKLEMQSAEALGGLQQHLRTAPAGGAGSNNLAACDPAISSVGFAKQLILLKDTYEVAAQRGWAGEGIARKRQPLGDYVSGLFAAVCDHVTMSVASLRDSRSGAVYGINNVHFVLRGVHQNDALVAKVQPQVADKLRALLRHFRDLLLQDLWVAPLQALSGVHMPETVVKTTADTRIKRTDRHAVKASFANFNAELDKLLVVQAQWRIQDDQLRDEVCKEHHAWVMPVYKAFFNKFAHMSFTKNYDKYVRFTPEGLETIIAKQLFRGVTM